MASSAPSSVSIRRGELSRRMPGPSSVPAGRCCRGHAPPPPRRAAAPPGSHALDAAYRPRQGRRPTVPSRFESSQQAVGPHGDRPHPRHDGSRARRDLDGHRDAPMQGGPDRQLRRWRRRWDLLLQPSRRGRCRNSLLVREADSEGDAEVERSSSDRRRGCRSGRIVGITAQS